jgi:GH35 family endo-1,4-beta-xylanase
MMPHTVYLPMIQRHGRKLRLGCCYNGQHMDVPEYAQIISNYDVLTPEVAGCWYWYRAYGWTDMDELYKYVQDNNKQIHYAHLRWWYPSAEVQPPDPLAWIFEAMTRYPEIRDWTVVNEGFWDGQETIPLIRESYQYAREIRPDARLFYNGLFLQSGECDYVLGLIDDGLVDGVGIQCHHNLFTDTKRYIPLICELGKRGIAWRVSELDVEIPVANSEFYQLQAVKYQEVVDLVQDYQGEDLGVWGAADCVSWLPGYPTTFDMQYKPKPAWWVLCPPSL